MTKKKSKVPVHTGRTSKGHIRDIKIDRIGGVTILKRGPSLYLCYRENGQTKRPKIDGNLAVARATAADVVKALSEERLSPFTFHRTSPDELVTKYLAFVRDVQRRAYRTHDRYRAALERFLDFSQEIGLATIDRVTPQTVEQFVLWLRGQTRCRNGANRGKKKPYQTGGIEFILSTARTAFNWAARNRRLPPYAQNPFSEFPSDLLGDDSGDDSEREIFSLTQEERFFAACCPWQRGLFVPLAGYGLRVGELTHLLIENVDFVEGLIRIRSKPELHWTIKTRDKRDIPLTSSMSALFRSLIGTRTAGFVFLNKPYFNGECHPSHTFANDLQFRRHLERIAAGMSQATQAEVRKAITAFCRSMGQIPEKRLRLEFCKLTEQIGCPEFTRAHDLRHLFTSRAQTERINPLLVGKITGHRSAQVFAGYSHFDLQAKRAAMEQFHSRFQDREGVEVPDGKEEHQRRDMGAMPGAVEPVTDTPQVRAESCEADRDDHRP